MPISTSGVMIDVDNGVHLAVTDSGARHKPILLLSNSLATSSGMWSEVVNLLTPHIRIVRYDTRGHGASDAPGDGYTLERLGLDALAILDALDIPRAYIGGLSLGGLTAMWLGIHAADRVCGLVLANTAASFPPEAMWRERAATARSSGLSGYVQPSLDRWVTQQYRDEHPVRTAELAAIIMTTSPAGYAGCCEVLATADLLPDLPRIACPVHIIAGSQDLSTPPTRSEQLRVAIPQADLTIVDAAHISAIEIPQSFVDAVRSIVRYS
ncbi:alpha/beta fold hydrolase [Tardiphaga sp. 866_E4_N2_1]|uniref:alpha/beta fold hydrolase n=1 Tax=unclassified Tardiphaga TaxID=2631404 RepID=UPI003F1E9A09